MADTTNEELVLSAGEKLARDLGVGSEPAESSAAPAVQTPDVVPETPTDTGTQTSQPQEITDQADPSTLVDPHLEPEGQGSGEPSASPPVDFNLADQLRSAGFELGEGESDPVDLQRRMIEAYRQQQADVEQYRESLDKHRQALQDPRYLEAALGHIRQQYPNANFGGQPQSQQSPPQEVGEEADAQVGPSFWNPPAYDAQLIGSYKQFNPETNSWVIPDSAPESVRRMEAEHQAYIGNWVDQLTTNPVEALRAPFEHFLNEAVSNDGSIQEYIERQVQERASQIVQSEFQTREVDNFLDAQIAENAHRLYEYDARTNQPRLDPAGNYVLTPSGQRMRQFLDEEERMGNRDPRSQWQRAIERLELEELRSRVQEYESRTEPSKNQDERNRNFLRRNQPSQGQTAQPLRDRSGSDPAQNSGKPQNSTLTSGDQLVQAMLQAGQLNEEYPWRQ